MGLTSFYTVYDYTTSGHTDLLGTNVLYIKYIYIHTHTHTHFYIIHIDFYTLYLFTSNAINM